MDVDCEGCAGCCIDWRPLADGPVEHERRGRYEPLDDAYNLVPLERDEVRAFVEAGYGDALEPRLFRAEGEHAATVDGQSLAAIDGRPAFYVGLRKPPKPVAPFGVDPAWLDTCVFLDPTTLQCRIHGEDLYPEACATYPGDNLAMDAETECERVERAAPGDRPRLLDASVPEDARPLLGPGAVGSRVFVHPAPERLTGTVSRLADGAATDADRAEFVGVAAAASPGTTRVAEEVYEEHRERALAADSWVGQAIAAWRERAGERGGDAPDPALARDLEDAAGAPGTPGWDEGDAGPESDDGDHGTATGSGN